MTFSGNETTDEVRLRVARQYLKQFSDAAQGRRREPQEASSSGRSTALEADPAFDSAGEGSESGGESDEESSDNDIFLDADTKAAVVEQLKRKAGEKKVREDFVSPSEKLLISSSSFCTVYRSKLTLGVAFAQSYAAVVKAHFQCCRKPPLRGINVLQGT